MNEQGYNLDSQLLLDLNGSWGSGWDNFFYLMSDKLIWIPLYLLILFFIYRRWGWKTMLFALLFIGLAVGVANETCDLAKHGFQKLRPTHNPALSGMVHTVKGYLGAPYGTFSAHAANAAVIVTFSALLFRNKIYTILICFWVLVICYSRIYLGVHFPADILFGLLTGIVSAFVFYRLFRSESLRKLYTSSHT